MELELAIAQRLGIWEISILKTFWKIIVCLLIVHLISLVELLANSEDLGLDKFRLNILRCDLIVLESGKWKSQAVLVQQFHWILFSRVNLISYCFQHVFCLRAIPQSPTLYLASRVITLLFLWIPLDQNKRKLIRSIYFNEALCKALIEVCI